MLISKIQAQHRQKMAYVYLRQSTMAQVYHHQESTHRQYALKDRALELGWMPDQIRVLVPTWDSRAPKGTTVRISRHWSPMCRWRKWGRCSPWKYRDYHARAATGIACWRFVP